MCKKTVRKRRHQKRVLFRYGLLALISLLIGISIYLWNARTLAGDAMPMPFGFGCSLVLSGSMEPTLHENDLVFVKEEARYTAGDIIVFQSDSSLIVHRIIAVLEDQIQTKGDANSTADAPIRLEAVKGRVTGRICGLGYLVRAIKTPIGTVLILAAAFWLLILSYRQDEKALTEEQRLLEEEIDRLKKLLKDS